MCSVRASGCRRWRLAEASRPLFVSKAEGAIVDLRSIEPSKLACTWAAEFEKDPRVIELVLREARRIIKMDRSVLIAETRHGFVAANAGIDQSNVPGDHFATTLPPDPDASARRRFSSLSSCARSVSPVSSYAHARLKATMPS